MSRTPSSSTSRKASPPLPVSDAAEPEILMGQSMLMKALQRGEGEIVLNVYPSQGMDERELAQYVMRELEFAKARRAAAIG